MKKSYTAEHKAKAVKEALKGDRTIAQVASEMEASPNLLARWKSPALANLAEVLGDGDM
ncbi:MAG: transposase [Eubacteriaceae bacterium]|nr:transposase [Eubacteriaceae bacterium]